MYIPLYQIVMHGLVPYSTKAVNGTSDAGETVLRAIAAGSNLRFDLLAAETSRLKDTDFDPYFYAYADEWTQNAAQYYAFAKEILAAVSDAAIIRYEQEGDRITTTYDNGAETVVDLHARTVSLNGQTRSLKDYVPEGDGMPA